MDITDIWVNEIQDNINNIIKQEFDQQLWNNDNILQALKSLDGLQKFISHKINTTPT